MEKEYGISRKDNRRYVTRNKGKMINGTIIEGSAECRCSCKEQNIFLPNTARRIGTLLFILESQITILKLMSQAIGEPASI